MFKLRKEHLDAFEAQATNQFANRVFTHVKSIWSEETEELGEPAVRSLVQSSIQRAATLGMLTEYDVVRFVDLSFILAADFETNPLSMWTRPFIVDKTLTPTAKLDRIYERMENEFTLIEKRRSPGSK